MRPSLSRLLATTALGAPLALGGVSDTMANDIGKVAAVNPSMDGTPPQASSRQLALGAGVLQNERIQTSEDGSGQLLFLDQTSLSIAPQSDIVLDRYVYDADQQTGEVALTLTKGVLRMIGGRITKRSDGIIRTPTATIGVRGGLALVIVDPSGQTRVCHVAGQYTKISPDAGGELILSRPNACGVVPPGQIATFDGLISSEELSEIYRQIEGNGNGGRTIAAGAINTKDISGVNSDQKRGPNDAPVSTSGHSYAPEGTDSRDENQPLQDQTVQVISVEAQLDEVIPPAVVPPAIDPPVESPRDPVFSPFLTGLDGGSVLSVNSSGSEGTAFFEVLQGSLIGSGIDGSELRIPVPDTGGVNDAAFDTDNLLVDINQNGVEFTATELASGSGLFEFFTGDEEFDGNGDLIGGSVSSEIGDIEGVGFADPSEEFTYVEFSDGFSVEPSTGFAVFGNRTFGQSQFAEGEVTLIEDPNLRGSFTAVLSSALVTPELVNGIANTVEGFAVQPNTFLHSVRDDAPQMGQTPFFMVGNQGFARYARNDTIIDAGSEVKGSNLVGGGKWLTGALYIGTSAITGAQESDFMVFADDIRSFEGSGPVVAGTAFVSNFFEDFDAETDSTELVFSTGTLNLGTLEDQNSNTVFGETNRYMVLSNLHRSGLNSGDSVPPDFSNDTGAATELVQIEGDIGVNGTTNLFDERPETPGEHNALLARDSSLDEVITNPLPLAGARLETFYDTPDAIQVDELNRGFAAGMAVCEGGQCGDIDSFTTRQTGLSEQITEFSGTYSVRSDNFDEFTMNFGGHELQNTNLADVPNEAVNFDTSNQVQAVFSVNSSGVGDVVGANDEGFNFASYEFTSGGTTSAYIDDNRFALQGLDTDATVSTPGARQTFTSSTALASAGLVGTGDLAFPADTELNPQFARWGWWSASLEVPIESAPDRTDIIHLGNWVAGVGFDFQTDTIPGSGVAQYDGLAVGTMTDLVSFEREIVGGNFNMSYDFGSQRGSFNLNIPAASINENVAITGFSDVFSGSNVNTVNTVVTDVNGAFFANPNETNFGGTGQIDGFAGVGGTFQATDVRNQVQTTGVFAGDRANFAPLVSAGVGTDTVPGGSAIIPGTSAALPTSATGG